MTWPYTTRVQIVAGPPFNVSTVFRLDKWNVCPNERVQTLEVGIRLSVDRSRECKAACLDERERGWRKWDHVVEFFRISGGERETMSNDSSVSRGQPIVWHHQAAFGGFLEST